MATITALVLLAIAAAIYLYVSHSVSEPTQSPAQSSIPNTVPVSVGQDATPPLVEPLIAEDSSAIPVTSDTADDCFSPGQLETHPMFAADVGRIDLVATNGPTIASYRGLSAVELGNLATQGDSAAMAVLGAMSVMRARNLPDDRAVAYLLYEDKTLMSYRPQIPPEPDAAKHFDDAANWFYQSALHGRVLALNHIGGILWLTGRGPVELGWIEKEEYVSLKRGDRNSLMPGNLYNALAFEIAPQLRDGPFGTIFTDLIGHSERQQPIITELAEKFHRDREAARLPPIVVPESTAPSIEVIKSMLCDSYLDPKRHVTR